MLSVVRASFTVQLANTHDETLACRVLLSHMHVWFVMGHGDDGLVSVSKRQVSCTMSVGKFYCASGEYTHSTARHAGQDRRLGES